jgi:hypothetical protein
MKKIVIIRSAGNELANQLWNYASIYAYTLENGHSLENPAFFEYGEYFNMKASPNFLFKILFFNPFRNYTKRKTALKRRVWRKVYSWYSSIILWKNKENTITATNTIYYFPPKAELLIGYTNTYFDGWLFRNPIGLRKYHKEITEYLKPRRDIQDLVESKIKEIRSKYTKVIGVHIRQGDYKTWKGGVYFLDQGRVREVLNEYISKFGINKDKTCFFIASDGKIDESLFSGLNIVVSKNNAVTDLFLLSRTDTIIGSNSTFGAFASYYGDIPFIVMQKNSMDWDYYSDKVLFFENKYSTMVNY